MAAPMKRVDFFSALDMADRDDKFLADAYASAPHSLENAGYHIKAAIASKHYGMVHRIDGSFKENYSMLEIWASIKGKTTLFRYASKDVFWNQVERSNTNSDYSEYDREEDAMQTFKSIASVYAFSNEKSVKWNWVSVPEWRKAS